jgi:hypothetical protein
MMKLLDGAWGSLHLKETQRMVDTILERWFRVLWKQLKQTIMPGANARKHVLWEGVRRHALKDMLQDICLNNCSKNS